MGRFKTGECPHKQTMSLTIVELYNRNAGLSALPNPKTNERMKKVEFGFFLNSVYKHALKGPFTFSF